GLHRLDAGASGPAILLLHGAFSGHTVWLRGGFASLLRDRGFDVWLADLRGHGVSDREPAPRTWWFEDWIDRDAPALLTRLRDRVGGRPLGLIGHSAGGTVGLGVLARGGTHALMDAMVALGTPGPRHMGSIRFLGAWGFRAIANVLGRFPARILKFGGDDEGA